MERALIHSVKNDFRVEGGRCTSVWHRRGGKDDTALNFTALASQVRVGSYWHLFPQYKQAKKAIWNEKRTDGRRYLDIFPGFSTPKSTGGKFGMVERKREDEMFLEFTNGSSYQLIGADDFNNLVGANPVGLIVSEYPLINKEALQYLMPMVLANGGWVWWVYTPRGKRNHGYTHYNAALNDPNHHCELFTIDQTLRGDGTPIMGKKQVEKLIDDGFYTYEKAMQEFYCSWEVDMTGAYYKYEVEKAKSDGRWDAQTATYEPNIPVDTFLDIGRTDYTTLVFAQRISHREWRIIDCYWNSQKDLRHYIAVMREKQREFEWDWGEHHAPHDIKVTDWAANDQSRLEIARSLGINYKVMKKIAKVEIRIEATRKNFGKFVFNGRCRNLTERKGLLNAIELYSAEYNEEKEDFNEVPMKGWQNHYADAFGAIALVYGKNEHERNYDKYPKYADEGFDPLDLTPRIQADSFVNTDSVIEHTDTWRRDGFF